MAHRSTTNGKHNDAEKRLSAYRKDAPASGDQPDGNGLEAFPKLTESITSTSDKTPTEATGKGTSKHQRFCVADPVAFRYLAEDRSTTVLERKKTLQGYQCYVIEQWACSRRDPTFVILAHTGNPAHTINVGILSIPSNEHEWSPELKMYFRALTKLHARRRDTEYGTLMVTNLSGFPSSLTLVNVPDGDIQKHREIFFVNEDLKRLGCSGRAGLTIVDPSTATKAKFYQIYKISEKIPLYSAIIELVKLCQAGLALFGHLESEYADGLLCDVTERSIGDWWADIGVSLYNIEPNDGVLGPTTVAAILGTLMGARNRLSTLGAPVTKDVFDLESTKKAVSWFQKMNRISPKSRRLDRTTLERLHKMTAKQASAESWTVPRAVKSTMAELSGKGGEMMLDMVGKGERATIADIETTDYDRFVQLVKGDRAKWLWHGKARKRTTRDVFSEKIGPERATFRDDGMKEMRDAGSVKNDQDDTIDDSLKPLPKARVSSKEGDGGDEPMRQGSLEKSEDVLRNRGSKAFDKAKDRIKDAVIKRTHGYSASKDNLGFYADGSDNRSAESLRSNVSTGGESHHLLHEPRKHASHHRGHSGAQYARSLTETPTTTDGSKNASVSSQRPSIEINRDSGSTYDFDDEPTPLAGARSMMEIFMPSAELYLDDSERVDHDIGFYLRHRSSYSKYETLTHDCTHYHSDDHFPRHLSFSSIDDPLLRTQDYIQDVSNFAAAEWDVKTSNARRDLLHEKTVASSLCSLRNDLVEISHQALPWVDDQMRNVLQLHTVASEDIEQLSAMLHPQREDYTALNGATTTLTEQERHRLEDATKELDTLKAKLQYEITALQSKVEEVEGTVAEYERQVAYTESRVEDLTKGRAGRSNESWTTWAYGLFLKGKQQVPRNTK